MDQKKLKSRRAVRNEEKREQIDFYSSDVNGIFIALV